jgi:hypothetical protein
MRRYYYTGLWNSRSVCGLQIIEQAAGNVYVILTELKENSGTPVTYMFDTIATDIYHKCLSTDPNDIIWIEHYNQTSYDTDGKETFNFVKMGWDNRRKCYHSPKWRPCDRLVLEKIEKC